MTREEIIEALGNTIDLLYDMEGSASNFSNVNQCNDARHKLEDVVKQMQEPSLPSNLDEATEEIASDIAPTHPDIDWDECFEKIKDGIKAGAEWMAGQGITVEGTMGKDESDEEDPYYFITERSEKLSEWVHKNASWDSTRLYLEPYIIQIRKK